MAEVSEWLVRTGIALTLYVTLPVVGLYCLARLVGKVVR